MLGMGCCAGWFYAAISWASAAGIKPLSTSPLRCPRCAYIRGCRAQSPLLCNARLWSVFCVTPVLRTGCGVLLQCLFYSHRRVQPSCGTVVVALSLPLASMRRLRDTVLVGCGLCGHWAGVPVAVWFVSSQEYRFKCCPSAVW